MSKGNCLKVGRKIMAKGNNFLIFCKEKLKYSCQPVLIAEHFLGESYLVILTIYIVLYRLKIFLLLKAHFSQVSSWFK